MTSPSGRVMLSGCSAWRLLFMGTLGKRKWAVAPESAMASVVPSAILMVLAVEGVEFVVPDDDGDMVEVVAASEGGG